MRIFYIFSLILSFFPIHLQAQIVKSVSEMRKVMMGEDLGPHLLWDTIPHTHLFGISPLERIKGEITIIDGQIFEASVNKKGTIDIQNDWNVSAPCGVYAHVQEWQSFDLVINVQSETDLQTAIENFAKVQGYDLSQAFPFWIKGTFDKIDFHIISKPKKERKHNHDLHNKAKKHFFVENTKGEILGFYSQHHMGIFTHRGSFVHTHFIDAARKNMGHIESVTISQKVTLLLPKQQ